MYETSFVNRHGTAHTKDVGTLNGPDYPAQSNSKPWRGRRESPFEVYPQVRSAPDTTLDSERVAPSLDLLERSRVAFAVSSPAEWC